MPALCGKQMDLERLRGGVPKALGALGKVAPEARAEDCQKARCSLIFQFSENRSEESSCGEERGLGESKRLA